MRSDEPPGDGKGERRHPVEPDRGIRGIRDERIAGFVKGGSTRRGQPHSGKLVENRKDLARAGRSCRGALSMIGQDDLAIVLIPAGTEGAYLIGLGDPDRDPRHRASEPGEYFSIKVDKPGIRGGHVNRH